MVDAKRLHAHSLWRTYICALCIALALLLCGAGVVPANAVQPADGASDAGGKPVASADADTVPQGAPATPHQLAIIKELTPLLDGSSRRTRFSTLTRLKKAGFDYQRELTVPQDANVDCKDRDARAVIAGMISVDWDYALLFGQTLQADDSCDGTAPCRIGTKVIAPPPLSEKEWAMLRKNPGSKEVREAMAARSAQFYRTLLEQARHNAAVLEIIGARLYGASLEALYIAGILTLAAEENQQFKALRTAHTMLFERQAQILAVLLRDKDLGSSSRFSERAALVGEVLKLLRGTKGKNAVKNLQAIVALIQPERDYYLAPCQ